MGDQLQVMGALLQGFGGACINLKILGGEVVGPLLSGVEPQEFYPLSRYTELTALIDKKYPNPAPIKEQAGVEMMNLWYQHGPGKSLVSSGVGFLKFQTGSGGYYSVVKGTPEQIGSFQLRELDEAAGRAVVFSSTPLDRDIERGVLLGGMRLCGDLKFVGITPGADSHTFNIKFK